MYIHVLSLGWEHLEDIKIVDMSLIGGMYIYNKNWFKDKCHL